MNRRRFLATLPALAAARSLLAASAERGRAARLGLCTFSCHLQWRAVQSKQPGTAFVDAAGFYEYGRTLGAEGVQTSVRLFDAGQARALRARVEATGGCYEGDVRLPKTERDLAGFEREVSLTREAGATVARGILLSGRRYETFATRAEFRAFQSEGARRLQLAEPVLRAHRLRLALENHKDFTVPEMLELLRTMDSEWLGALVDTGNNIALLEEPHAVVEALAPFVLSVHLKDMAVAPHPEGFLLSEVPLGTGFLDLPRIVSALSRARAGLVFNLEMATRDPLVVPCKQPKFWATFPQRDEPALAAALARVQNYPARQPLPRITGRAPAEQLADEESNNRTCLAWMQRHIPKRV
jgi:3-oxoisoapionate decarboxylase